MSTAIAIAEPQALQPGQLNREQIELLKRTICKDATDDELRLFSQVCAARGMDPFSRQIYAVKRQGVMTIQTSIDGFRLIAERTGKYGGQLGPFWCGTDGVWKDVWLAKDPPAAARVGVIRTDFKDPLWSVAKFSSYNAGQNLWNKMPEVMIAKCAESNALRKAFPQELSGLYADDEMDQADNGPSGRQPSQQAVIVERAVEPTQADFKGMLTAFATIREKIGDALYYKVLKAHGVEHSNEFKSRDAASACYKELRTMAARAADETQAKAEAQSFVDEVNPETAA